ncbi:hypothetical protein P152DRAFT_258696 [Eremomyces bilateralis CBS 781.70]|uniref:WW domain-containing protein n=1 Tax=Eremomyces bilateralis CBS 781.70 TaxID=1392243 RepID=A0A6G1FQI2_9PEZI|nr:uncharacterized protein P152DRAFT_258696 [Eremomyces bilateralis CBS 781.70]KAF1808023.1 hypothetical protein P152DRAFT_258696 [Eremomyces bilateralis CBS 781.70]
MLKSTHHVVNRPPPPPPQSIAALQEGWTEHTAPSGHNYYYHAATKKSTYTRPAQDPPPSIPQNEPAHWHQQSSFPPSQYPRAPLGSPQAYPQGAQHTPHHDFPRRSHDGRRQPPADRPKHLHTIPNCDPWVLVITKLGRRFVHNVESGESFWKFPPDILLAVIKFDHAQREGKKIEEGPKTATTEAGAAPRPETEHDAKEKENRDAEEQSEYEEVEVEVTDSEDEEMATKRLKLDGEEQAFEFNEDDMAYQLEGMGEDDFDAQGEFDDMIAEEDAEADELSPEDAELLFQDLLDDHHVNPYTPWESVIENDAIIDDSRYTVLPNMKSRLDVFNRWSRQRIEALKEAKAKQEKRDPRIAYLALLDKKGSTKLYWPEFKRKYRAEPTMKDGKLLDRDREKLYREHVKRLQQSQSSLKADLTKLLQSLPLSSLNRSTSLNALPSSLATDIRLISLPEKVRNPIIESHISNLPEAPDQADRSESERFQDDQKKAERDRRERALTEREQFAREQATRNSKSLMHSRRILEQEQREVQDAMRPGMKGLKSQLEGL